MDSPASAGAARACGATSPKSGSCTRGVDTFRCAPGSRSDSGEPRTRVNVSLSQHITSALLTATMFMPSVLAPLARQAASP